MTNIINAMFQPNDKGVLSLSLQHPMFKQKAFHKQETKKGQYNEGELFFYCRRPYSGPEMSGYIYILKNIEC